MSAAFFPPSRTALARALLTLSRGAFSLSVLLLLLTPGWQVDDGPWALFPLFSLEIGSEDQVVGVLVVVPFVAAATWLLGRLWQRPRRRWPWRPWSTTLPLLAFAALILIRAWSAATLGQVAHAVVAAGFTIGVYLYVLQEWSARWSVPVLACLGLVQGAVGTSHFFAQRSVGLHWLGEPLLIPGGRGVIVVESAGRRWLRAYGLTPHPDVLGGQLGVVLLVCLGALPTASGWRRLFLYLCAGMSALGLFFSFSRSAWLGTLAGLIYLLAVSRPWRGLVWSRAQRRALLLGAAGLILAAVVLLVLYGDLLVTRFFRLQSPLEHRSLDDRRVDLRQAWMLIRSAPLVGVGSGRYIPALYERAGDDGPPGFRFAPNTPLLATAELGVLGGLLVLWLYLWPTISLANQSRRGEVFPLAVSTAAALLAMAIAFLFHSYLYPLPGWWYGLLPTLLLGLWARRESFPQSPLGGSMPSQGAASEEGVMG